MQEALRYVEQRLLTYARSIPFLEEDLTRRLEAPSSNANAAFDAAVGEERLRFMFETLLHASEWVACRALQLGVHLPLQPMTVKLNARWGACLQSRSPEALAYAAHIRVLFETLAHLVPRIIALR